jgi:hypothetical protein
VRHFLSEDREMSKEDIYLFDILYILSILASVIQVNFKSLSFMTKVSACLF